MLDFIGWQDAVVKPDVVQAAFEKRSVVNIAAKVIGTDAANKRRCQGLSAFKDAVDVNFCLGNCLIVSHGNMVPT